MTRIYIEVAVLVIAEIADMWVMALHPDGWGLLTVAIFVGLGLAIFHRAQTLHRRR